MKMPRRFVWSAAVAALVGLLAGAGSAAMAQGLPSGPVAPQSSPAITLHADGERATVRSAGTGARSLLAELAQRARFSVVNLDRVPETPIAVEFTDTPIARVVESVLRGAAVDFIAVGGQPGFGLSKVIVSGRTASAGDRAAIGSAMGNAALAGRRAGTAQALPPGGEDRSAAAADPEPPVRVRDLDDRRMLDDTRTALVVGGRDRQDATGAGARTGTAGPGAGSVGFPIGGAGMAVGGAVAMDGGGAVVVGGTAGGGVTGSALATAASSSSGTYSQPVRPVRLEEVVMPNAAPSGPPVGGPVTVGTIVGGAQSPVSAGASGSPTVTTGTAPVSTLGAQTPGMPAPGPLAPVTTPSAPASGTVLTEAPPTESAAPGAMPLPPGAVSAQPTTGTITGPVPMTGPPPGTPVQSANPTPPKPATTATGSPIIK